MALSTHMPLGDLQLLALKNGCTLRLRPDGQYEVRHNTTHQTRTARDAASAIAAIDEVKLETKGVRTCQSRAG